MILAVGSGFICARTPADLPFAWFVQTVIFVTFNKVCTSQVSSFTSRSRHSDVLRCVIVLHVVSLVLAIGSSSPRHYAPQGVLFVTSLGWSSGSFLHPLKNISSLTPFNKAAWLSIAYRLEFLGQSVFIPLWVSSVSFLAVNTVVLCELIQAYK